MVRKILVTGGKGYVGGRICEYLVSGSNFVVITSRNNEDTLRLKNIKIEAIDYYEDEFEMILEDVDTIVHLAALNEIDCVKYPYEAVDFNIKITLKWLRAAEKVGVRKFIYFSTIHVYGAGLVGEVNEQQQEKPIHPYSITHKAAEDYVLMSRLNTDLDAIVLRMSNSFGYPLSTSVNRWTLLVNDLCRNVVNTNELVLRSDGLQFRDFITLTDVTKAVRHFIELDKSKTFDGVFNLCSGYSVPVYDMTKRIAMNYEQLFGIQPIIKRAQPVERKITPSFFSIEKLNRTGYHLNDNVDGELQKMLLFCMKNFKEGTDD